ncbi:MAG: hypothetical protein JSW58_08595 [Candidatus Latescibacterota bacterium]|nr:MAG: hypothetical protein JSW58_08595 [Candidatus Latescibacterota bacterium]
MRRYWDLSERERAELNSEEIENFRQVELMEKGLVVPEKPKGIELEDVSVESVKFYVISYVGRYSHSEDLGIAFSCPEDAEAFLALRPRFVDYDTAIGSDYKTSTPLDHREPPSIKPIGLFPKDKLDSVKEALRSNKKKKEAHRDASNAYQRKLQEIYKESEAIISDWHQCIEKREAVKSLLRTWNRYVELAEGDEAIAGRFLAKAYEREEIQDAFAWERLGLPDGLFEEESKGEEECDTFTS